MSDWVSYTILKSEYAYIIVSTIPVVSYMGIYIASHIYVEE